MIDSIPVRTAATYLTPLREGGSLPAVVEDTEGGLWVVKFRGAGQGPKALVAELIVGLLAAALDLDTPGLAVVEPDESFGQGERDPEIRDILRGSIGSNVGLGYLDGAFNLDPVAAAGLVKAELAARIVWLDSLVMNPDRTARNPNMMVHHDRLWLIDHGAALFDHHAWSRVTEERTRRPFSMVEHHVLLASASSIEEADGACHARLGSEVVDAVVKSIPDELLYDPVQGEEQEDSPEDLRGRYRTWLSTRLEAPREWVQEAERVRRSARPPGRLEARR